MKGKNLAVLTCMFIILFSPVVFAGESPYYFGINGSATLLYDSTVLERGKTTSQDAEFDTGVGVGAALGYDFGTTRVEGEVAYRTNDFDKLSTQTKSDESTGDCNSWSFLLNCFFELEGDSPVSLYFVAGLGLSEISVDDVTRAGRPVGNYSDTVFAYQFGTGLGYAINESVTLDLGYRYFATSDADFDGTDFEYATSNFTIGARFAF